MASSFPSEFVSGAITAGYVILGLLFLRFWRRTHDALFANFAVAFWLLALNQGVSTLTNQREVESGGVYLIRLAAFVVIIVAIVGKNLRARRS